MSARPHLLALVALVALAIESLGTPVAANGPTVRFVDDDGRAGTRGCAGAAHVPDTIQGAVDVSGPGDTIMVCPGAYPEQVVIAGAGHRGLSVVGVRKWAARVSPSTLSGATGGTAIVRVAARDVRVEGLKVVARATGPCDQAEYGIKVGGVPGAVIRGNRIVSGTGGDALQGPCGMVVGIAASDGSRDAVIAWNFVQDFRSVGILAHHAARVRIANNSVRFLHRQPTCASVACLRRGGTIGLPAPRARGTAPALIADPTGIRYDGATGRIEDNVVLGDPASSDPRSRLAYGITSVGGDRVAIQRNIVTAADQGIVVDGLDGGLIRRNTLAGTTAIVSGATAPALLPVDGIGMTDTTDTRVLGNRVQAFGVGVDVASTSTANRIKNNDFLGNAVYDCQDGTGDTLPADTPVDPIDNVWTDNLGNADDPLGLCTSVP